MAANAIKKIVPMLDRILIQRAESVTTTKGGIVLPEKAVSKVLQGTVVAVGPGSRNPQSGNYIPMGVKEGDRVLLPEYGGTKVELEDKKEYMLFRESDILAKLE
ncbi:10 kDa heat shock protein, mitochondrial [Teleopsis dalmanni]|uniref:10 kDa heat shock protein, mitochondrial n=1 Tax=Teleopsis dalmanni TaxID=139649 RepID=UPI0018CE405E|nr:10 kDa heat shock protein, mitochondrial [Teleopsis dalmanni]